MIIDRAQDEQLTGVDAGALFRTLSGFVFLWHAGTETHRGSTVQALAGQFSLSM